MVLGLRGKNRRSSTVQIDYLVHIQEIKPWPPTQSLRSLRSVLIQWGNGERSSGSTNLVVPSLGSVIGEGKIEFNESFNIPVTLLRDMSVRGGNADVFQKNCLEFNLYEPRRDKAIKGQLLGTAVVDLADYGMLKETLSISAPLKCKRNYRNTDQPLLFIKIQPIEKDPDSSSLKDRSSKAGSKENSVGDSVSELMNEEYTEEAEIASFTDDDISSHSSVAAVTSALESNSNGNITPELQQNGSTQNTGGNDKKHPLASEARIEKLNIIPQDTYRKLESSSPSSVDVSSDLGSPLNGQNSVSSHHSSVTSQKHVVSPITHGSSPSLARDNLDEISMAKTNSSYYEHLNQDVQINTDTRRTITTDAQLNRHEYTSHGYPSNTASPDGNHYVGKNPRTANKDGSEINDKLNKGCGEAENYHVEGIGDKFYCSSVEDKHGKEISNLYKQCHVTDEQSVTEGVEDQIPLSTSAYTLDGIHIGSKGDSLKSERLKHVKSVRSPMDSTLTTGSLDSNHHAEVKDAGMVGDVQNNGGNIRVSDKNDAKVYPKEARSSISERKINILESKINMLEGELREAAAIEVALYSVVAEHGSSMSKIYAPARRLSRLYLHACKENLQARRAGAAKSAVSGLVLVAKACGNDVPRLTFWLSNSIVLRTIICQTTKKVVPFGPSIKGKIGREGNDNIAPSLRWKGSSPRKNESTTIEQGGFSNWDDPLVFTSALEKVEAWIFSRIVESIWWLTMTPHMHHVDTKVTKKGMGSSSWRTFGKLYSSCEHEQGAFSQDIWKDAFREAYEKLCPMRAGGHECGCLPVLSRLIMEQCVARLDVAMFNAILRESADEIPTDPVSDPINDPKVLPIPLGKSSFGAGVQLKTVIGNWSRWLSDLFGIDDDDSLQDNDDPESADNDGRQNAPCKSFHLLNALSELLMLPKDMLVGISARKEACPMFSAPVIRRVLNNFSPDEFCPDPIPSALFEALDSEDDLEDGGECVKSFPCIATPIVYIPPPASSIASIIGEVGSESKLRRSRSSVLRKAYATTPAMMSSMNSTLPYLSYPPMVSCLKHIPQNPTGSRKEFKIQPLSDIDSSRTCGGTAISLAESAKPCYSLAATSLSGMSLVQKKRLYPLWQIRNNLIKYVY